MEIEVAVHCNKNSKKYIYIGYIYMSVPARPIK